MTAGVLLTTDRPGLLHRGKVRDLYELPDGRMLMVATDRISAFDVVMPQRHPAQRRGADPAVRLLVRPHGGSRAEPHGRRPRRIERA